MRIPVLRIGLLLAVLALQALHGQFSLKNAFPNLRFNRPVDLQHAGDGSKRIFVVEQRGVIAVFANDSASTAKKTFLDITGRVDDSANEEGLLGLAFHPDFENNGYFYVNYTRNNPTSTVIARYKVSGDDPDAAEPDSEEIIISLPKPFSNHNAGQLAFGPQDGYLYITAGDGGLGGDPQGNGQNLSTLLGAILRIDVDHREEGLNYAIPPANPFKDNLQGYREEIYAYGLRNPWRMSFDPPTGWLWCADVGQNQWEEINLIESGKNYGWNIMEGFHCFSPPSGCNMSGLELPVWEYSHSLGTSVTGGYVYRGAGVPELQGKYIYADFGSGRIWSLEYDGVNEPLNSLLLDSSLGISSFGIDNRSELYICAFDGNIYRFKPTVTGLPGEADPAPDAFVLEQNYPNPFNPGTVIPYRINRPARVRITIYDLIGRMLTTVVDRHLPAGSHTALWDGKNNQGILQPSGIYFYRLTADEQVIDTRRMVLLK